MENQIQEQAEDLKQDQGQAPQEEEIAPIEEDEKKSSWKVILPVIGAIIAIAIIIWLVS